MFDDIKIFKSKEVKTRKKHECMNCHKFIKKGSKMVNTVYSYDNKLISVYFCVECEK